MFANGKTPCPVCGRKYAHLATCRLLELHEEIDKAVGRDGFNEAIAQGLDLLIETIREAGRR